MNLKTNVLLHLYVMGILTVNAAEQELQQQRSETPVSSAAFELIQAGKGSPKRYAEELTKLYQQLQEQKAKEQAARKKQVSIPEGAQLVLEYDLPGQDRKTTIYFLNGSHFKRTTEHGSTTTEKVAEIRSAYGSEWKPVE